MDDTAYILTYRANGEGERRGSLLAVLRWRHGPDSRMRHRADPR